MPSDYPEPQVEVWDENWKVIELYQLFSSQWRTGPGGLVGLDYNVFQQHLFHKGVAGDEYDDLMHKLGIVEAAAIATITKK